MANLITSDNTTVKHKTKSNELLNSFDELQTLCTDLDLCCGHFGNDCDDMPVCSTDGLKLEQDDLTPTSVETLILESNGSSPHTIDSEESIEIVGHNSLHITQLNVATEMTEECMFNSNCSGTSTNNTDICVLHTYDSHYGAEDDIVCTYDHKLQRAQLAHALDAGDFTLMHNSDDHNELKDVTGIDDSTEILLMHSDDTTDKQHQLINNCSGTDSDVEILLSEEINDSDWSTGISSCAEKSRDVTPPSHSNDDSVVQALEELQIFQSINMIESPQLKEQVSTDKDISVEELSTCSLTVDYTQLSRTQLLSVIHEQSIRIQQLENTLQRVRDAQESLAEHVDAVRAELDAAVSTSECAQIPQKMHAYLN